MKILKKVQNILEILNEIRQLPRVNLTFISNTKSKQDIGLIYKYFTKRHPKYKIIRNKEIGVGLINLTQYVSSDEYLKIINGKNSAAYYARKAKGRGYILREIMREDYKDDIYEINTSMQERQGRKMAEHYLQKIDNFENLEHFRYFGVLDSNGKLRSYCNIGYYGDFVVVSQLLGHKDYLNDGVMYLMITEVICELIAEKKVDYLMYDTFFGAKDGLKMFKEKLGFLPYRVKWRYDDKKNI